MTTTPRPAPLRAAILAGTKLKDVDRGDVVLVEFPFSDLSKTKKRPALVVQCNENNKRLDDVTLALITSNTNSADLH